MEKVQTRAIDNEGNVSTSQIKTDESVNRLNKDFIQSFEDRVFAIYNKFDVLLSQQQENIASTASVDQKKFPNARLSELNEQKAQFSEEMARELSENVNFDEISSNPELVKRLKELYKLVKTNGKRSDLKDANEMNVKNKFSLIQDSANSLQQSDKAEPVNYRPRKMSVSFGSIKSNADIREVYTIVNNSPLNSEEAKHKRPNSIFDSSSKSGQAKVYKLPENLSNKINGLINVTLEGSGSHSKKAHEQYVNENESGGDGDDDKNELTIKPGENVRESFDEMADFDLDQVTKMKINYVIF